MKLGIVVYSDDSETVWNASHFGNFTRAMGDEVNVFFLGKDESLEHSLTHVIGDYAEGYSK